TVPTAASHRYEVPLHMVGFALSGRRNQNDPLPTAAPLPFAPVHLEQGGTKFDSNFVIDTGAQVSILSIATAISLGLDTNHDGNFNDEKVGELNVSGVGGSTVMPLVNLGLLRLHTSTGIDVGWTNLTVGVRDIDPAIPGVFGMERFTAGWSDKVLTGSGPDGYLNSLTLDLREGANGTGKLLLDVNPALDVVQNPQPWQNYLNVFDVDKNGSVVPLDALIIINELNRTGPRALE